jgi:sucrose-6-phosphate hydrolase SacC (GH32 family)
MSILLLIAIGADSFPETRPKYHLTSAYGNLNDPNGLFYYKGVYHVFHQWHNPPAVNVAW